MAGTPERAERVVMVAVGRGHARDEQRLAVPSQAVLQHAGQLAVAVRHVLLACRQRLEHLQPHTQG